MLRLPGPVDVWIRWPAVCSHKSMWLLISLPGATYLWPCMHAKVNLVNRRLYGINGKSLPSPTVLNPHAQ